MQAKKLKKGDEVRVIAPSGSLARLDKKNFEIAKKRFLDMGLKLTVSKNAYNVDEFSSSSIEERVEDFHEAFLDKNVKLVICAIGGYNSIQLIDKIDYNIIKENPKLFIGYSDNTVLLNAIYKQTGLVTYLGPNFTDFGVKLGFDYTLDYFKKIAFNRKEFSVIDSKEFSDDQWYINQDNRVFINNEGRKVVNKGIAKGKIVSGNISSFQLLQGTKYMPNLANKILFLEDDDLVGDVFLFEFDRNIRSILLQKGADKIKGLVIGRMQLGASVTISDIEKVLKKIDKLKDIPVIINVDFGHTRPLISIPIGGTCSISNYEIKIKG